MSDSENPPADEPRIGVDAARVAEEARIAADAARVAEEARVAVAADAARVAEEARVAVAADAARVAEEARIAALNARERAAFCLRGLRKRDHEKDGFIHMLAFDAPPSSAAERERRNRMPPGEEVSVYWDDDEGAIAALKEDKGNAGHGVARLAHQTIGQVHTVEGIDEGDVGCERDADSDNSYHGNILYRPDLSPGQKRQAQMYLALMSKLAWKPPQR